MEQKIKDLKTASNIISIITKIGYTVMIVMLCICATMFIFLGVTGGETSRFTIGKTNIILFDRAASTPAELMAVCSVLLVTGAVFLAIFLLAYRMFREISQTGDPFKENYAKVVRAIGILIAAMPIATGIAASIASLLTKTEMPQIMSEIPGIVIGAIVFCLSYIIAYGCGIRKKLATDTKEKTEI